MILASFVDLTDSADAWRFELPVGSMNPEHTNPALAHQGQAETPPIFQRPIMGAGFKLALDRIMRFGGVRTPPRGPAQNSPRLRRRLQSRPGAIQSNRTIHRMPAGLVPTSPAYESFLDAAPDDYIG